MEELYTPFVQNKVASTFSGTKYNSVTNVDPSQKFTSDLEHLRYILFKAPNLSRTSNKKAAKSNAKKDEFKIDITNDMNAKIVSIRDDPNLFSTKSISPAITLPVPEETKPEKTEVKNEILEEEEEEN